MVSPYLDKVAALVTRRRSKIPDLLLIEHPYAGIQIPAGTVEEGEEPSFTVLRETAEETGLTQAVVAGYIGWMDELPPGKTHVVCQQTGVYSRPDPGSIARASLRRGISVHALREEGGFVQVTYEEGNRYPEPTYIIYQITGWVPDTALALAFRRHIFHLTCPDPAWEPQPVFADQHIYRPFWAPLGDLPDIVAPQRAWLDYVSGVLGYELSDGKPDETVSSA